MALRKGVHSHLAYFLLPLISLLFPPQVLIPDADFSQNNVFHISTRLVFHFYFYFPINLEIFFLRNFFIGVQCIMIILNPPLQHLPFLSFLHLKSQSATCLIHSFKLFSCFIVLAWLDLFGFKSQTYCLLAV